MKTCQCRLRHTHTHTHTHTRFRKNKPILFLILMAMFMSFNLSAQERTCTPSFNFNMNRYNPLFGYSEDVGVSRLMDYDEFNSQNPQVVYELPTMERCDCLYKMKVSCNQYIDNSDIEVYDENFQYLFTFEDIEQISFPSGECYEFPSNGIYYFKIIRNANGIQDIYGWYKLQINKFSEIEDAINVSLNSNDICLGQQVCVNLSDVNFAANYNFYWNNVSIHSSVTALPDNHYSYCFNPGTVGVGELRIQVLDYCGGEANYYYNVNVRQATNFTLPTQVCVNQNVTINTSNITWCNGPVAGATYSVNWGNGTVSNGLPASHTYTTVGNYNVTLTINTPQGSQTIVKQIQVNPLPNNVTITGHRHTCAGTSTYTITNPQQGTNYTWSIVPSNHGTIPAPNTGTTKNITWNTQNFSETVPALLIITSNNGCVNKDTIKVWKCCTKPGEQNIYDQTIISSLSPGNYYLNGTITFTGNFTNNDVHLKMGPEANIIISPNSQITFNTSAIYAECNHMWNEITVNPNARVTVNNSEISHAYRAINSLDGGRFTLYNTLFNQNLVGINVQTFAGSHLGTISKCTFKSTDYNNNPLNLIAPYANRRGETGIKITNVNNIQIGNTASTANQNIFKHLDYGVYIDNSNVTLYNNSFGPMPKTSGFIIPDNGCGIYSLRTRDSKTISIGSIIDNVVYTNVFSDCAAGIYVNRNYSLNIHRNTFNNNDMGCLIFDDLGRNVNFTYNKLNKGQIGFWINNFSGTSVNVLNNIFDNVPNSIYLSNNVPTFITSVNVSHNTMQMGFNPSVTGGEMYTGIGLSNVQGYNDFFQGVVRPRIYGNDIRFNSVNLNVVQTRNGIFLDNSPMTLVDSNRISYRNLPIITAQANRLNGVNIILSTNVELCSNELKHLANGVRVEGFCNNSRFIKNHFIRFNTLSGNQQYGFKFESATIGVQGTPTQTWDNTFDANFLPGSPNRGVGSIALQQQWNYKNNNNMYLYRISDEQVSNTLHVGRNIFSTITCGQQGGFFMNGFSGNNEMSLDLESEFLENDAENKYFKAYTLLNSESSFNESEAMLSSNISSSTDVENISKFSEVNRLVKDRLFESADSLNQLIEPVNLIEKNMKTVNEIYLRTWAKGNYNLNLQDYTTLVDIAMQTPKTSGYGVIGAWVMVGRFDNTQETEKFSNNKINIISNNILMYPNPATSQLSFEGTESVAQIFIHDVMGRLVRVIDNQQLDNAISISISDLKKGIYIVTYTNELKEKVGFEKLTIN
jgi:hypothetical protein